MCSNWTGLTADRTKLGPSWKAIVCHIAAHLIQFLQALGKSTVWKKTFFVMLIQLGMVMEMKWSTVCEVLCCVKSIVCHPTFLHVRLLFHLLPCCFIYPSSPTERKHSLCKLQWNASFFNYYFIIFCNDTQQNDITDIKQEVKTQADNLSFFPALCSEYFVLYSHLASVSSKPTHAVPLHASNVL